MRSQRAGVLALVCVGAPIAVIALIAADASARRAESRRQQPVVDALAQRLPISDLALSGGARWLRAPSLEEPNAAFADGPALPDPDPAGGAMAPPSGAWPERQR